MRVSSCLLSLAVSVASAGFCLGQADSRRVVGLWLFDEDCDGIAEDASSTGRDGAISNAKRVPGRFGGALAFDNAEDFVEVGERYLVPVGAADIPTGTEPRTVTLWFRATTSAQEYTNGIAPIFRQGANSDGPGRMFSIAHDFVDGKETVDFWGHSANLRGVENEISLNTWHFVAVTYDGHAVKLYIDGVLRQQGTPSLNTDGPNCKRICFAKKNRTWGDHFRGMIDEVALFNGALTQREITEVMTHGLAKSAPASSLPTYLTDHEELSRLVREGAKVGRSGSYDVWLWARDGSQVKLAIDGKAFPVSHRKGRGESFSWAELGKVELQRSQAFRVDLTINTEHSYFDYKPAHVGYMALSLDDSCSPREFFELARVFAPASRPSNDKRLVEIRNNSTAYAMPAYATEAQWQSRARYLRTRILVSCGLYPTPKKTPLNARVFGKIDRDDYSVEKVYFESYPGFFVTGNLYRPKGRKGPFPGISTPHGHWPRGRLQNTEGPSEGSVPGRCINLAKQGYVTFSYSMVGYNDSRQLEHRFGRGLRPKLWGISLTGLQLWNSVRALDFLSGLPDVDPDRIGVTGHSGGGTQTYMIMAVDDRVKVAVPVNMLSAHFQGGCLCEHAPGMRIDTYNMEIAALMAPRPLMLVSNTADWTRNTPKIEYPAVRSIYRLLGVEERICNAHFDAGHNFNKASREAVYPWLGKWLQGSDDESRFREQPFQAEDDADLLVFDDEHLPPSDVNEESLTEFMIASAQRQLVEMEPSNENELLEFKRIMAPAMQHCLAAEAPKAGDIDVESVGKTEYCDFTTWKMFLGRKGKGEKIPAILYVPRDAAGKASAVLVVHPDGKAGLVDVLGKQPGGLLSGLLEQGHMVLAIDYFLSGEYHTPFEKAERKDIEAAEKSWSHLYFCRTNTAYRVQDILTALGYLKGRAGNVNLVCLGEAGLCGMLARGVADGVKHTVIDVDQFDSEEDESYIERAYVPLLRRAGGFRTAATLATPANLTIYNTGDRFVTDWIRGVYQSVGASEKLRIEKHKVDVAEILEWSQAW